MLATTAADLNCADAMLASNPTVVLCSMLLRLERLELSLPFFDSPPDHTITAQQFSALTASSFLTELCLLLVVDGLQPLHEDAVQYVFPPNKQMTQLKKLTISTPPEKDDTVINLNYDNEDLYEWCINSAKLEGIMQCCPNLEALGLMGTVAPAQGCALVGEHFGMMMCR